MVSNDTSISSKVIKNTQIYEGKAKILFSTNRPDLLIQYFKDDATAFNGVKKSTIATKGELNNLISESIMTNLSGNGINNHFISRINEREQLIKKVAIIPLEVIVRNVTAGSLAKKFAIAEGVEIQDPIIEICYKDDALGDPLINEDHAIKLLKIVTEKQMGEIKILALKINKILQQIFLEAKLILVDFKIEFGLDSEGKMLLADEISPDSCRLWDITTKKKLDKDVFRYDLGDISQSYREIAVRMGIAI
jgi:phosphoribosylaminoimidazole-succinocarboxamide synthase